MAWAETTSSHFTARHHHGDVADVRRLLRRLEELRERLAAAFPALPEEVDVVVHGTPAQLDLAHPAIPVVRRLTAPAARRYVVGWAAGTTIHVLAERELQERASAVPGSREMLLLAPLALLAQLAVAACNPQVALGVGPRRLRRGLRWAWLGLGAGPYLAGQTAHARPAIARRLREGPPPAFPPGPADALLLGGTVLDLLAREEGVPAALRLACDPAGATPEAALEGSFHGRALRHTESAWRAHLERLAAAGR